jgi:hypothetical protein
MRKLISAALAAAVLAALLAGCGGQGENTANTAKEKDIMEQFTVETQQLQKQWYTDDKTVLLAQYDYSVPHMAAASDASDKVKTAADTFNAAVDKYFADLGDSFAETTQYAKDQYEYEVDAGAAEKGNWGMHYSDMVTCEWNSVGKMLSVQRNYSTFAGGAHGYAYISAWNYDVENAKFITDAASLGSDSQKLRTAVAAEIIRQAKALDPELFKSYWSDYESIVANWNVDYFTWFTPDGMCVSFPSYALAPYAAGEQRFVISYDVLSPYLSDYGKTLLGLG